MMLPFCGFDLWTVSVYLFIKDEESAFQQEESSSKLLSQQTSATLKCPWAKTMCLSKPERLWLHGALTPWASNTEFLSKFRKSLRDTQGVFCCQCTEKVFLDSSKTLRRQSELFSCKQVNSKISFILRRSIHSTPLSAYFETVGTQ